MALTRYTFTGQLQLEGALHIGSGGGGRIGESHATTDATVVRDSRGQPYIPGSSLRGILRTAICQLAPIFNLGTIREDEANLRKNIDAEIEKAQKRKQFRFPNNPFNESDLQTVLEGQLAAEGQPLVKGQLSSLERLFGTTYWASPLLIPDLHLHDIRDLEGEVRHGVGIDRDTGAARENFKYDFEVLPKGVSFDFWMRCEMPEPHRETWEYLLALGLRLLQQGELLLGGRAARGVGQVKLINLNVYVLSLKPEHRAALLDALLADNDKSEHYGTHQSGDWVRHRLEAFQKKQQEAR
jgi:CRISPR-associated RAMP protein (TIGR02581 family)